MPRFSTEPPGRNPLRPGTFVLLVNLGSPEAPTTPAVRRYLGEFLSDPRVVELPRLIWWPILHGFVLTTRPRKSAAKYAAIWTSEGSPLLLHTEKQAKLLAGYLGQRGRAVRVAWAMRYGTPSVPETLSRLKAEGMDRLLVLPMYPQYAASTTGSAMDAVAAWLARQRKLPELRAVRHFHDQEAYLAALEQSVREHWRAVGLPDASTRLVISFHGLPQKSADQGDPYPVECGTTARLLTKRLGLEVEQTRVVFQSRFGKTPWLRPYTVPTLQALAQEGVKRVDILCPGFVADCLETLEEIAHGAKTAFLAAGGREFHYIPALNERQEWITALADLAETHLQGWGRGVE